jgi:tRNA threonylcarbamoyladenosine biosynthesis protein TsaB
MQDAVLALELSTGHGSVAVAAGDEVLYEASFEARRSHNAMVFEPLKEALLAAGSRLCGIVVGTGPGSYTGVRIAISAAQGVALSRCVPVVGMSSFFGCVDDPDFGVVGDARRGRFFVAQVRGGELLSDIALVQPEALESEMAAAGLERWISCGESALVAGIEAKRPLARRLALKANGMRQSALSDLALEPIYLEGAFITQPRKRAV